VARVGLLAALARAPLARGQASDPSAMECSMDNLGDRLKTIESICCTSPTMCAEGPPSDADQCTVACGEVLAPLYDECHDGLAAMGVSLDGFYTQCLESLYKPGRCGGACSPATLNCRLTELNEACCATPGSCASGSIVPHRCSVECALITVPFATDCKALLQDNLLDGVQMAALHTFAQQCVEQDLTEIVEYGFDLFSEGCTIEFGVAPEVPGGWVQLTPQQIGAASCQRISGDVAHVAVNPSGRLDFVDYQEDGDHSGVLRCDIMLPTPFTKVRGTYVVNPTVPATSTEHNPGDATDPDNTYEITNWGDDPPGHAGSFVFGTEHDMVDRGEEMGANSRDYQVPSTITIPETVVTRSSVVRLEMCQSAAHEDFALEQISIQVRPPSPPPPRRSTY
jgi:hypothetical protein